MKHPGKIAFPDEFPPDPGTAREIADGILWIRLPLPFRLDHVNVYALDDGDGWTVIDAGIHSKRGQATWNSLLEGPLAGKPLKRVVLTHHHPDHVGSAGWLRTEFGAEIWATRTAWLMARMLTLDVEEVYPPETVQFYRQTGMGEERLAKRIAERPFNFADTVAHIPLGYRRIQEGETITIGGRVWDIRIGNGHAPEHATFWSHDGEVVISGDQVIPNISSNLGVYPTEPEADPVGEWLEACERFKPFATDDQLVLPGHKMVFTGLPARLNQLIENHHTALERLLDHLEEPQVAAGCFVALFGREIEDGAYGLALVEAVGHLNHLLKLGKVERTLREDGAYVWHRKRD